MAKATIFVKNNKVKNIESKHYVRGSFVNKSNLKTSILTKNKNKIKLINTVSYAIINVANDTRTVKLNEVLPFRVKFTNIGIEGYSATNPAGVGIAVIGFSNYIL